MLKLASALLVVSFLTACTESGDAGTLSQAPRVTPVTIGKAQRRDIDYVLTALGSIESIQHPTISAETRGQITRIDVSEGDPVAKSQQLTTIDNTLHLIEAAMAEAELKRQAIVVENQRKEVVRLKRLEKSQSVSRDQLEDQQAQLQMLQAQRDVAKKQWEQALYLESKTRVLAPQSGLIARRHVSVGDYVSVGRPLFDLVSVKRLRARLSFPEQDAAKIGIGKEVVLLSPTRPDTTAKGEVTSVKPQINVMNRAIEVTVEFDNPGGWLPGASVDATMVVERHQGALTVPLLSVVRRSGREVVFVLSGDVVTARGVTLGWREENWIEVVSGLRPEDRIVVEGAALISDGSLVAESKVQP